MRQFMVFILDFDHRILRNKQKIAERRCVGPKNATCSAFVLYLSPFSICLRLLDPLLVLMIILGRRLLICSYAFRRG